LTSENGRVDTDIASIDEKARFVNADKHEAMKGIMQEFKKQVDDTLFDKNIKIESDVQRIKNDATGILKVPEQGVEDIAYEAREGKSFYNESQWREKHQNKAIKEI
jgi:hypothetical protein